MITAHAIHHPLSPVMLSNLLTCNYAMQAVSERQQAHRRESRSAGPILQLLEQLSSGLDVCSTPSTQVLPCADPLAYTYVPATLLSNSVFKLVLAGTTVRQPRDAYI